MQSRSEVEGEEKGVSHFPCRLPWTPCSSIISHPRPSAPTPPTPAYPEPASRPLPLCPLPSRAGRQGWGRSSGPGASLIYRGGAKLPTGTPQPTFWLT